MVRIYDVDAIYDTNLDGVWSLLEAHTDEALPQIHPDMLSVRTTDETETTAEREVTRETPAGGTTTEKMRFTADPPRSLTIEYLEGPMAGSWITNTYIPEGKRTRVIVTGDVRAEGLDDEGARQAARALLDLRYDEDVAWLAQLKRQGKVPAT